MHPERLLDDIWQSLEDATRERTPFTLGQLGTVGLDGAPQVRAVILRRFDREPERIHVATNAHSAKVSEIRRDPRVALTVYDDSRGVQLRMTGSAGVVEDESERLRAWNSFGPHSRALYRSPLVPGSSLPVGPASRSGAGSASGPGPGPGPEGTGSETANPETSAFERFAWVGIELERIDRLSLAEPQHERWSFTRRGDAWTGRAVVP